MRFSIQPPRIASWFALVTSLLAFTRFLVLFFESFSVVRAERQADIDLIQLCSAGAARDSEKFRAACLQARSEQAAPVILKAILRAIRTGFADFAECFNSPSRIAILLLFCLSGLALPIVKAASALAQQYLGPDALARVQGLRLTDEDEFENGSCEVVLMDGQPQRLLQSWGNRLRALPGRSRRPHLPSLSDLELVEDADGGGGAPQWTSVKLGKGD